MKTQGSHYTLRSLFMLLFFVSSAQAHPIVQSWQNRMGTKTGFSLGPKVTYFSTHHNYDLNAQSVLIANNISAERYYIDANLSYGFSEDFFIFSRFSGLYVNLTGTSLTEQSIFGLGDQMFGTAYRIFQNHSGLSIHLQGEATIPAYTNSNSLINSKPYLGDGSIDFTIGGFAQVPITTKSTHQIYLDGGAGYTYRSYGYSSAIPWNILLKRDPTLNGLTLALGLRGNLSLETDTSLISRVQEDQLRGGGGSYLINAINPSWTLAQASVGYQTKGGIHYTMSGAIPIAGKNSPDGMQVSFGVQFEFANEDHHPKKSSSVARVGSFQQYDLEAKVLSMNDQLYLVKIDQGSEQGIEKGQIFDIFMENQVIAKAKVTNVKSDESVLRVLEYFKEQSIEVDATAKRILQDP